MSSQVMNLGGKTSEMKCPRHLSAHMASTWPSGAMNLDHLAKRVSCQVSPLTVTIFYFPQIPSLEGSLFFSSLFFWHHLTACGILVPWAKTSTLAAGGPLDFSSRVHLSAEEGMSSGLISAVAMCSWSWTSSGPFRSTLRHQHQVSGIHPEVPPWFCLL